MSFYLQNTVVSGCYAACNSFNYCKILFVDSTFHPIIFNFPLADNPYLPLLFSLVLLLFFLSCFSFPALLGDG